MALLLTCLPAASASENCHIAAEQGGIQFPVDRIEPASRCLIGTVVNGYTTAGVIGSVQIPIGRDLYDFLLDRPVLTAMLVQRAGMGAFEFSVRGPNRFWANDGEGTQGLITLLYRDQVARVYHVDGHHQGHVFPMIKAKAVVFMKILPEATQDGHPVVETSLVAYTHLNDPILAGLVRILRPLIGEAVTNKLLRGFQATAQLAALIAQDPDAVAKLAASLTESDPEDVRTLTALLQTMRSTLPAVRPPRPTP
jgi:hypothetical protein